MKWDVVSRSSIIDEHFVSFDSFHLSVKQWRLLKISGSFFEHVETFNVNIAVQAIIVASHGFQRRKTRCTNVKD